MIYTNIELYSATTTFKIMKKRTLQRNKITHIKQNRVALLLKISKKVTFH